MIRLAASITQATEDLPGSSHSEVARAIFASYDTHSVIGQHNLHYEIGWHTLRLGENVSVNYVVIGSWLCVIVCA